MQINLEQLKALVEVSKQAGTEAACLGLAIEFAEAADAEIKRLRELLKEAIGELHV